MAQANEAFPSMEMAVQTDPPGRHPNATLFDTHGLCWADGSLGVLQEGQNVATPERNGSLRDRTDKFKPRAEPLGHAGALLPSLRL